MTASASASAEVTLLRRSVPEFEPIFQAELREEEGELGAFQAVSVLAEWVRDRLDVNPGDDAAERAFAAVERLITEGDYPLGDSLAAEFIEVVWDHPDAAPLMGDATRRRAQPR